MTLHFSTDDPTDEANHWLDLMLGRAERTIDFRFGSGFAKQNPNLVAAYIQAGMSFISSKRIEDSLSAISGSIGYISEEISKIDFSNYEGMPEPGS